MMLEEAIQHCRERALICDACGGEHLQLAQWLEELLQYRRTEAARLAELHEVKSELCAYKDTGLTPEEIIQAANRRHDCKIDCLLKKYNELKERLEKYQDDEEKGLMAHLPCGVNDTVYMIESVYKGKKCVGERVVSGQIDHITIGGTTGKPVYDVCTETGNWYCALEPGDFFPTREAAEQRVYFHTRAEEEAEAKKLEREAKNNGKD
jgi:hypothetical protein